MDSVVLKHALAPWCSRRFKVLLVAVTVSNAQLWSFSRPLEKAHGGIISSCGISCESEVRAES